MRDLGPEYARVDDDAFTPRYWASCHCGAVRYEVSADPLDAKICHCRTCQSLHGAPMQWAAIFHKRHVRLTRGIEHLRFYSDALDRAERAAPCKVLRFQRAGCYKESELLGFPSKAMRCTKCGTESTTGSKFCDACGTALAQGCPACGATNRAGARFCNACGAGLGKGAEGVTAPDSAQSATSAISIPTVTVGACCGLAAGARKPACGGV